MKIVCHSMVILFIVFASVHVIKVKAYNSLYCNHESRCGARLVYCPAECPNSESRHPEDKVCRIDCESPKCKAELKRMILNLLTPFVPYFLHLNNRQYWDNPASGCYDPRPIGGDVSSDFYFHGKSTNHFTLISDSNLQINARFRGHQPAGRNSDFTWIEALGILFNSHTFSVEATKYSTWDSEVESLKFSYDGKDISVPTGRMSSWESPEQSIKIERTTGQKSVIVTIPGVVEIVANAVPVTNSYGVHLDDHFARLEIQFRFFQLSDTVEGMLGRIYQPDFEEPAKLGVVIPVVGGEHKYSISSLLSGRCRKCVFSPSNFQESQVLVQYSKLDCFSRASNGNRIVCRKSGVL